MLFRAMAGHRQPLCSIIVTTVDPHDKPLARIETAKGMLALAIRINAASRENKIPVEIFAQGVQIITGGKGLRLPPANFTKTELEDGTFNLVIMALGTSAIMIDQALESVFHSRNPDDTSPLGSLRALIYMIRCAFAHNPIFPRWEVRGKYQRLIEVPLPNGQKIVLDTRSLHGSPIAADQFGGLEAYMRAIEYAEALILESGA